VSLVNTSTWEAVSQAVTDAGGYFEIRDIEDGEWRIMGGKELLMFDSVMLADTSGVVFEDSALEITGGRLVRTVNSQTRIIDRLEIRGVEGVKTINWVVKHGLSNVSDMAVKVRSPLRASVSYGDSLNLVGPGFYMSSVDAESDTLIDLSRHLVEVSASSPSVVNDTVYLSLSHVVQDTMNMVAGGITLSLRAHGLTVDTAMVFFKDMLGTAFDSAGYESKGMVGGVQTCAFSIVPPLTGSNLVYYFKAVIGDDIYGYSTETYTTFVEPDCGVITKIEIFPSTGDTLLLPADAIVTFTFNGYYGSKFIQDTTIQDSWVSWTMQNSTGCGLGTARRQTAQGKSVDLYTPLSGTGAAVVSLIAKFDTTQRQLDSEMSDSVVVYLRGSPERLDSLFVRRVDEDGRAYITTTPNDNAEFVAQGFDTRDSAVTITPVWKIDPVVAGEISPRGLFSTAPKFAGFVQIEASVGTKSGKFNVKTGKNTNESGLAVHYIIPQTGDSVFNG
jgi:hypothetical protein